jgi:hypothetical protein
LVTGGWLLANVQLPITVPDHKLLEHGNTGLYYNVAIVSDTKEQLLIADLKLHLAREPRAV